MENFSQLQERSTMKSEEAPPNYSTATDPERNAPPSYDSIFGKYKAMKDESSGNFDFCKKMVFLFFGSIGCTVCLGLFLALPIAMIVIGAKYLDDCPEEDMIPVWLIVSGVVGLVRNMSSIFCRCCCQKKKDDEEAGAGAGAEEEEEQQTMTQKLCKGFDSLLATFAFAWFIAGNVWVYRTKGDISDDPTAVNFCDPTVYWFSFWVITVGYILMGVALLCCCFCCICLVCCCGKKEQQ